ncbi:Guanine nucleotide-binding protein-like 1 [Smittium culicis]|uniref:Guanine nucleotide-binding protein-like 1 n=1 Tax=Smittium culicis TaxID=133412 RepID=A0A1R1Y1Y4_9FUNG|nr:Guanine nucleotide-binding protein-like 1 [Smittium culicis]
MARKKPYSVKQKKAQLQEKRAKKRDQAVPEIHVFTPLIVDITEKECDFQSNDRIEKIQNEKQEIEPPRRLELKVDSKSENKEKLISKFEKLSVEQIAKNKELSMKPLNRLSKFDLEVSEDSPFIQGLDIPFRPSWNFDMSKQQVEKNEALYFEEWVKKVEEKQEKDKISLFEKNLEVISYFLFTILY